MDQTNSNTKNKRDGLDHFGVGPVKNAPTLRASLSGTFLQKEGCRKPVLGVWNAPCWVANQSIDQAPNAPDLIPVNAALLPEE